MRLALRSRGVTASESAELAREFAAAGAAAGALRRVRPIARPMLRRLQQAASPLGRAARRAYHAPVREMRFVLHEVHQFEKHYESLGSETPCDRDTIDMVIDATQQLAENELAPINGNADSEGCTWVDQTTTTTPTGFKEAYQLYVESGWQGLSYPEEYGGQGLPLSLALVQADLIAAANWTFLMFPGLSKAPLQTTPTSTPTPTPNPNPNPAWYPHPAC